MIKMEDIRILNGKIDDLERLKQKFKDTVKEEADTVKRYRDWAFKSHSLIDPSMVNVLESIAGQEAEHSKKFDRMVNQIDEIQRKIKDDIEKQKKEEERKKSQVTKPY